MSAYQVVIVDDEQPNLESLARILKSDGGEVHAFLNPRRALDFIQSHPVDLVITDLRMGTMTGVELLDAIKLADPGVEVILITAYGTVELAVEAMKKGAYDFVTKPLQRIQILQSVRRALEKRRLIHENNILREELQTQLGTSSSDLLGKSEAMKRLMERANQAGRSLANVLIEGESGTGKGALAEFLHRAGSHQTGLFVKINCAAIPENLLEAELFGYEPGAFTGATKRKKGRVELADRGTLFLDEIGIAPPTFQAKLLRFLQEGEFERLGGIETLRVKTRVISATNLHLKEAVAQGRFREDLYYRLNVVHIHVPPLRERADDIPLLANKFLMDSARKNSRPLPLLALETMEALGRYSWPGNIRELQNLMERLVVFNESGVIDPDLLPIEIGGTDRPRAVTIPVGVPLRQAERLLMDETLKATRGDKKLAARLLGVHPRTIHRHLGDEDGPETEVVDVQVQA